MDAWCNYVQVLCDSFKQAFVKISHFTDKFLKAALLTRVFTISDKNFLLFVPQEANLVSGSSIFSKSTFPS